MIGHNTTLSELLGTDILASIPSKNGQLIRGDIVELRALIRQFKDHLRTEEPPEPRGHHGAFSASELQNPDQNPDQNPEQYPDQNPVPKPTKECLCGKIYWFSHCYYLIPSIRKPNWTPNLIIQQHIDQDYGVN